MQSLSAVITNRTIFMLENVYFTFNHVTNEKAELFL
jgi:hypothetical protein